MKGNNVLLATGAIALVLGLAAMAEEPKPRDLFYAGAGGGATTGGGAKTGGSAGTTGSSNSSSASNLGARVTVKLQRDGRTTMVAPDYTFRSGDKIRLVFATNFKGHLSVTNVGTTGRRRLLFPQQGETSQIVPSNSYEVPRNGWFDFDANPGEERLVITMSSAPLQGLPTSGSGSGASSHGSAANPQEEDEILAQLNSRALENGRDLSYSVDGNDGFALASVQTLAKPTAFTVVLKHR